MKNEGVREEGGRGRKRKRGLGAGHVLGTMGGRQGGGTEGGVLTIS